MLDGGEYFVARLHGDDVAAWTTYNGVDELEDSVQRVLAAGGRVIVAPRNAAPAGRARTTADSLKIASRAKMRARRTSLLGITLLVVA